MVKERNAEIKSTFLGVEDHGLFTFYLRLDYGGGGQGAGGYVLGSIKIIREILRIVGVDQWEELPGKFIRVKADHSKVYAMKNIIGGEWLDFAKHFEKEGG